MKKLTTFVISFLIFTNILEATHYKAYTEVDETQSDKRLTSFKFHPESQDWTATSISESDILSLKTILSQQNQIKRIYLPDPSDVAEIGNWIREINQRRPAYRPFIVRDSANNLVALVELHTIPRAVKYPEEKEQEDILKVYKCLELMTYDSQNTHQNLVGKYRTIEDGKSGMARMRIMLADTSIKDKTIQDIIEGTSLFVKKLADKSFPLHSHDNDPNPGYPKILMSYTALEAKVQESYQTVGFTIETSDSFKQYWPPEKRNDILLSEAVIVHRNLDTINSEFMDLE